MSSALIYMWPYLLYQKQDLPQNSSYPVAWALGLGSMYWWAGGIPSDTMSFATSYLVGGAAVYAYALAMK